MFKFLQNLVDDNYRHLNSIKPLVAKINSFEVEIKKLSDKELKNKTDNNEMKVCNNKTLFAYKVLHKFFIFYFH